MSDSSENTPPKTSEKPAEAERIAKVMARAGVASRREAERMILEGRVAVNGEKLDSPARDIMPGDRVTVDGKKLDEKQETRLWLYYKPIGLVTTEADEKGRQTVFDALPRDLPRVMTVGRLDMNSEGLLLLTNDGDLKRRLELPATGWLRRYRVRVNGTPSDLTFAPLRRGATIEGEEFAPMEIKLDSQQGANAWLTVGIREGRNREIRRAMTHVGLQVNRLIRIGYGPFKLTGLEKNQVSEVKRRVLRDQLGGLLTGETSEIEREMRPRGAEGFRARSDDRSSEGPRQFRKPADGEERRPRRFEGDGPRPERAPRWKKPAESGERNRSDAGPRKFGSGPRPGAPSDRDGKGWASKGERPPRSGKPGEKSDRPRGPRPGSGDDTDRPRRAFKAGPAAADGAARPSGKPGGKTFGKPGERKSYGKPAGRAEGDRTGFKSPRGTNSSPRGGKPFAKRPGGGKPRRPKS